MAKKGSGKDLTGMVFGKLTVLEAGGYILSGKTNRMTWWCECQCQRKVRVFSGNLVRPDNRGTKSCGKCTIIIPKKEHRDFIGKKFGKLEVIEKVDRLSNGSYGWKCLCSCGNIKEIGSSRLLSGKSKTCGDKERHPGRNPLKKEMRYEEIPLSYIAQLKKSAKKRKKLYDVTPEYLWNLFLRQNRECTLSGMPLQFTPYAYAVKSGKIYTTASLDRINNSLGYVEGNLRWVHKKLNIMRGQLDDNTFYGWCKYCTQYKTHLDKIALITPEVRFLSSVTID